MADTQTLTDLDRQFSDLCRKLELNSQGKKDPQHWQEFRQKQADIRRKLADAQGRGDKGDVAAGLADDYRNLILSFDRWVRRQDDKFQ